MSRALLLASLLLAGGCRRDLCASRAPAFEVEVRLEGLGPAVRKLRVQILAAGLRSDELLEVGSKLADGQTGFSVAVGEPGKLGFQVDAEISALDDHGQIVARGELHRGATGDACNFFTVALTRFAADAGTEARSRDAPRGEAPGGDAPSGDAPRADVKPDLPTDAPALDLKTEGPRPDGPLCAPACAANQVCCRIFTTSATKACFFLWQTSVCACDPKTGSPCVGTSYPACCPSALGHHCAVSCP